MIHKAGILLNTSYAACAALEQEHTLVWQDCLIVVLQIEAVFAEKFGTSFFIIRSDINGNIERLETAKRCDPEEFRELFQIVLDEIKRGKQSEKYSQARALLWLKR